MTMAEYYTIQATDVGKPVLRAFGRTWLVQDFVGRIFNFDIGKRVYRIATDAGDSFILQIESNKQQAKRTDS